MSDLVEIFYRTLEENTEYSFLDCDNDPMPAGYYYWFCFPGCLPESEPIGPYDSEEEAYDAALDTESY